MAVLGREPSRQPASRVAAVEEQRNEFHLELPDVDLLQIVFESGNCKRSATPVSAAVA
jgi:hypothetical protein